MDAFRALAAATACALGAAAVVPALPAQERRLYAFPHRPHLSPAVVAAALEAAAKPVTWKPGAAAAPKDAECLVCHDYSKGDAAEPHLDACFQCHSDPVSKDKFIDFKVRAGERKGTPFPHEAHLAAEGVTCATCHAAVTSADFVEFTMPVAGLGEPGRDGLPGGPAREHVCADCHLAHGPGPGSIVKQDDRTGDGKDCKACHLDAPVILPQRFRPDEPVSPAAGPRPFLHADHIVKGNESASCDSCHAPIRKSESVWDYDPGKGTADACAKCHIAGKEQAPLAKDLGRKDAIPFVTFSYFSHAAHLQPAGKYPNAVAVTASCDTCHNPARDARAPAALRAMDKSPEPLGRADLLRFEACNACHSKDWAVENHGSGAWSCFKCHDGGGADGKIGPAPAHASVERVGAPAVKFRAHHHPGVTSKGAALADPREAAGKECKDCHKGRIEEIPSGLSGKPFLHGPHLAPEPTDASCLECHPGVRAASWSEDLELFAGASCAACHAGPAEGGPGGAAKKRTVPQFDHRSHVEPGPEGSGFKGIRCAECHDLTGASAAPVPKDVGDCSRCHSHDPAKAELFKRTGPKSIGEAETTKCLPCHLEKGLDQARDLWGGKLPNAGDASSKRQRGRLDLAAGTQWHDLGGGCASCHDRETPGVLARPYEPRVEEAKVTRLHRSTPADRWFNAKFWSEEKDAAGHSCADCHRYKPGRASVGTRGGSAGPGTRGPGTRGGK